MLHNRWALLLVRSTRNSWRRARRALDEREACAAARASIRERLRRLHLGEAMRWPVIKE